MMLPKTKLPKGYRGKVPTNRKIDNPDYHKAMQLLNYQYDVGAIDSSDHTKRTKAQTPARTANDLLQRQVDADHTVNERVRAGTFGQGTGALEQRPSDKKVVEQGKKYLSPKEQEKLKKQVENPDSAFNSKTIKEDDQSYIEHLSTQPTIGERIDNSFAEEEEKELKPIEPTNPAQQTSEEPLDPVDAINVPISMFGDPTRQYLNTSEPATEEDRGLFESKAFQQTALVFGLDLLFGSGDIRSAIGNAAGAYRVEAYKETPEYAEFKQLGIPEGVIQSALKNDDWTELRAWHKDGMQYEADRMEALSASLAGPELSKVGEESFNKISKEAMKLDTQVQALKNGLDRFQSWGDISGPESVQVMYDFVKAMDPDSAVKEGEIALAERMMGSLGVAQHNIKKFFATGDISVLPEEGVRAIKNYMHTQSQKRYRDSVNQMRRLATQAQGIGASGNDIFWGNNVTAAEKDLAARFGLSV